MTQDNRIEQIRAVLAQVRVALPGGINPLDACFRIADILASAPPAPRVWFPGDTVPPNVSVVSADGYVYRLPDGEPMRTGPLTVVEVQLPTPDEFRAIVDRAHQARAAAERCRCGARPGTEHVRNCTARCQDCGGDPDGPRRCRCRATSARAIPEPTEGQNRG